MPRWATRPPFFDRIGARLVIVDPASAALADADVSQASPVRKFLQALMHEARQAECGVLVVSHSTKAARNAMRRGNDPGAGQRGMVRRCPAPERNPEQLRRAHPEVRQGQLRTQGLGHLLNERVTDNGAFAELELGSGQLS